MDWTPGGVSSDLEDRRDSSGGGGGGVWLWWWRWGRDRDYRIYRSAGDQLDHRAQTFWEGWVEAAITRNRSKPSHRVRTRLMDDGSASGQVQPHPPGEDRDVQLISFVLDDVQKTWTQIFAAEGRDIHARKAGGVSRGNLLGAVGRRRRRPDLSIARRIRRSTSILVSGMS